MNEEEAVHAKMKKKRRRVAMEILTTEETYVKNIQVMLDVFCVPMEANSSLDEGRVVGKDDVRSLFGNLKMILPINKMLLTGLHKQLAVSEEDPIYIGEEFKNMVSLNVNSCSWRVLRLVDIGVLSS